MGYGSKSPQSERAKGAGVQKIKQYCSCTKFSHVTTYGSSIPIFESEEQF